MFPRVYCIVLCYNGIQLTLECLESLCHQDYGNFQTLVVDNNSQDHTPQIVKQEFPQVEVYENGANLGYAGGNNVGIRLAVQRGADYIFLVNNDTWVKPACLSGLVESFTLSSGIGAAGPMVYTENGYKMISSAGGAVEWKKATATNMGMGDFDTGQFPRRNVDFINGCGILISKDVIQRVGLIDPDYFMYWEEIDWCMRIKKNGYKVIFEPASTMVHKAPIKSGDLGPTTLYYLTRNRIRFFWKHAAGLYKPVTMMKAFHGALRGVIQTRNQRKFIHARAMELAIIHSLRGKWGYTDPSVWQ